ncbi:uncharacterized protein SPAPADRAFT_132504 [Spathaspora passalidarum NRRL Y-27907]|uniref:VASt domain-containing protein n=1 Tax=Spathaspora passalidarum (strain NRRL Y-27907 / 11-Y1) TaxID=619300 RepID=G3AG56_SPAPN|nr:uncharacterized protein SPAPADRAFT_132504 [Spathaspora passalidarum NRRL Y-27907]EGW35195.1 hypothetical protein SPAPADRAFT_132504 [Spathaspora passalidarum NRRL Y-27907]
MNITTSDEHTLPGTSTPKPAPIPEEDETATVGPPSKSESTGFLSSLLSAAANKISSSAGSLEETPKKKDHSFSNKLDTWLKASKNDNDIKSTTDGDQASLNDKPNSHNDGASIISASDVQFAPVRESPLNTLGHGELSLDDFEAKDQAMDLREILPSRQNSTRSTERPKRELSPDMNGPPLSSQSLQVNGRRRAMSLDSNNTSSNGQHSEPERSKSLSDSKSAKSTIIEDSELEDISSAEQEEIDNIIDYSKKLKHASKKRNKEFHQVFKKLPSAEKLIDDFSCAVSKDILVQGKMYLSDHYICFNSNILGWVTNVILPLHEVIQIEKKSTAGLFPNGMIIRTLHHKYVFATFLSRDSTFELITNVWHRVLLENSDVDARKTIRRARGDTRASNLSHLVSNYEDSEVLDEYINEDDEIDGSFLASSDINQDGDVLSLADVNREDDDVEVAEPNNDTTAAATTDSAKLFKGLPIVGPSTHHPTESNYTKQSSDVFIAEEIFKVPPGVIFLLLFGPDTAKYASILKDQKNIEIQESSITALDKQNKERNYTYVKPLSGPIGPKQTKCIIADKLVEYNPEKYYEVEQTTQTPDVPSGNSFKIKTRFILTWAENNQAKMYVVTNIEWSGKSWIKGAIEKGSIDGQKDSMKTLIESLNQMINQGDKKVGKRKMTKGRKLTVVKREKVEEEKVEALVQPVEKSIVEKLKDLIESIGKLVPIPYLSSSIVGTIMILLGFMLTVSVFNRLSGSGKQYYNVIEYMPSSAYTGRMKINDREYMVVSSVNTNLNNEEKIRQQEISVWNWLSERSEGKVKISSKDYDLDEDLKTKYSEQELKELVRLTQLKLDRLTKELNL